MRKKFLTFMMAIMVAICGVIPATAIMPVTTMAAQTKAEESARSIQKEDMKDFYRKLAVPAEEDTEEEEDMSVSLQDDEDDTLSLMGTSTKKVKKTPKAILLKGNIATLRYDTKSYKKNDTIKIGGKTYKVVKSIKVNLTFIVQKLSKNITEIYIEDSFKKYKPTDVSWWFADLKKLTSIHDAKNLNLSSCEDMSGLFYNDEQLTDVDVSKWNTGNVKDMSSMFCGTSFKGNMKLQKLNVSKWNTTKVKNMSCMFYGCAQLTSLDLSKWNVANVTSFNHMFADCFKLKTLNLSKWNVRSCKTFMNMFNDCRALTTIGDVSKWNTASLIDCGCMFTRCWKLTSIDLSGWNTKSVKGMAQMFTSCTALRTLNIRNFNYSGLTEKWWSGAGKGIYYAATYGAKDFIADCPNLNTVIGSRPPKVNQLNSGAGSYDECKN